MKQAFLLNLHQLPSLELTSKRVSQQSFWHDDKWLLDGGPAGTRSYEMTINWAINLPDGLKLTDERHEYLLEGAKRFLWSVKVDPPTSSNFIKNHTLVLYALCLLSLLKWMVQNNYSAFSEIDAFACDEYRNYLGENRKSRDGNSLRPDSLQRYLEVLIDLYRQRDKLVDAIQEEPFAGVNAFRAAKYVRNYERGWIPYIPDQIALASLAHTLEWLDLRAEDIIRLLQTYLDASSAGETNWQRFSNIHKAITEFEFSTLLGASTPWHAKVLNVPQLRTLVDGLVYACANALLGFVGMRMHELLGLETGCVEIHPSSDGILEIFYLVGYTSKTGEQAVRWVAGTRLAGTKDIPPPIRAVQVLEEILKPWRKESKPSKLFLVFKGSRGFPKTSEHLAEMSADIVWRRLDEFNQKYVPLPSEWHFTSHQWRKTFARFVAMTDKSALSALSQHFLHISIAMTDRGYIGNDFELEELIDEMTRKETANILTRVLLHGQPVAGPMGEELQKKHEALRAHFRGMTIEDAEDEIRWIVEDSGMAVHSCEWGCCLYRQETSKCEGGEKGPNAAKRGPSVCAGCSNLLVEEKHREWWQNRLDRNAALLEQLSDAPELQKVAPLARVGECKRVLNMLDRLKESPDVTTTS